MGIQPRPLAAPAARPGLLRLVCAAFAIATAACHSMRPVQPSQLVATSIKRIWVTQADHSTVVVDAPQLRGDTLQGFVDGQYREMPLSQATSIQTLRSARGRTTLLAVAAGVAALGAFAYFENRSYVGTSEACSPAYIAQGPVDAHCGGPCPC
jgi:hypothetical protein